MKKFGFTLSETLIALVIIGVIASITIPTIIVSHRKEEASSRVKKFYSMLTNASTRAKADCNNWEYWAETASGGSDATINTAQAFASEAVLPYITYYNTSIIQDSNHPRLRINLNDGTFMTIHKGACLDFRIDINGEKKPNIDGRDRFAFLYCGHTVTDYPAIEKVVPYIYKNDLTSRDKAISACKHNKEQCSGILFLDTWQFKQDYPYKI